MKRLLTLAAMFLCCMATTFAQFSGSGSGTENDPYLILNPIQLNQLRNYLNKSNVYFKLMANIDLEEFIEDEYPSGGWMPIGNKSSQFKGILDGNGKTVTGLTINRSNMDYVGLFGDTQSATIKNLIIKGNVNGRNYVGGIAGDFSGGTMTNCSFEGKVVGESQVGGLCGNAESGSLSDCNSKSEVTGTGDYIGGIVGQYGKFINCIASDIVVHGHDYVGGICGYAYCQDWLVISDCFVYGKIFANSNVGGLCGKGENNISNSFVIGHISATGDNIGGLIGVKESGWNGGDLINCYFSGSVIGGYQVGGLIGSNAGTYSARISKCYALGKIAGKKNIGGLVGSLTYNYTLKASVAINTSIMATEGNVGRIVGTNAGNLGAMGTADENKSYNRTIVISQGVAQDVEDDLLNGAGVSATTLKLKATYVGMGWDFNDTWEIQETECYPYMKSQTAPPLFTSKLVSGATAITGKCMDGGKVTLEIDDEKQETTSVGNTFSFIVNPLQAGHEVRIAAKAEGKEQSYYTTEVVSFSGKGTEADPYQVSTAADLTQVYRKGYYKLMNDIDLADYINQYSPTEGWESIGREGSETIHFDGDGHKITGLWCNSTRDNTGLFSCFANGSIKNLTVEVAKNKQIKGGANTGILIGKMINGTIENCSVSGTVADGTPVGGIVGLLDGGKISLCQDSVTINTSCEKSYVGGLVGEITGGEIDQCVTQGEITATGKESYVGGLVGKNYATVTNSYSNVMVTSSYNAAGLIAYNYGVVDKCYATGDLFTKNYGAGIIGYNDGASAVVKNCVAMNKKIVVTFESQSAQSGGYGNRIIGGIKNGAPAPDMNNYALKNMKLSVNNEAQKVYDDILNGVGKPAPNLIEASTYQELDWDFTNTWTIQEAGYYPGLKNNKSTVTKPDDEPVTITANSYSREYGEANPTFEFTSVGAELKGTPEITCEATATSPVGTYPIVIKKGSVTNNNDTYVNGVLTITKAPLTVKAGMYTKRQGEDNPEFPLTYEGFKNNETEDVLTTKPTATTTATKASVIGEYPVTVSGGEAKNYELSYTNGKLSIIEREDGIYDLTADMFHEWDGCTVTSKVTKEDCGGQIHLNENLMPGSLVYGDEYVHYTQYADLTGYDMLVIVGTPGIRLRVLMNRLEVGNGGGDNHGGAWTEMNPVTGTNGVAYVCLSALDLTHLNSIKLDWGSKEGVINSIVLFKDKSTVAISAHDLTMTYGDDVPTLTYSSEGGTLIGTPKLSTTATKDSPVGTYPIRVDQGTVSNNGIIYHGGTLTITKAPLNVKTETYTRKQGENNPKFALIYDGFKNNETDAVLTKKPSASTTATKESIPGEYDITISGGEAQNYELSYTYGKLIITEADPVTVLAKSYTRQYGEDNPAFEYTSEGATLVGVPEITCEATVTSPVGTYPIVIKKGSVKNYNDTYINGTLTITKAPLTVKAGTYSKKQGEDNPDFTLTYEGFKNNDTEDVLTKKPVVTTTADRVSEPGEYPVTVSGGEAKNYELSYTNGKLIVMDADAVIITAKSYSREYGDDNPAFEYEVSGATLNGTPDIVCEATVKSPVGTYPIVIKKGGVTNYNDTYVDGILTITKAPLIVKVENVTREQYVENPDFVITYTGWKLDEDESVLTKKPTATTKATKDSPVGDYEIVVSCGEAKNYELKYQNGVLTVTESTGISEVSVKHPADVYTLQGYKVLTKATTLKGLPNGVYIVNGKKVVVKYEK